MVIGYERLNQLIAVSAAESKDAVNSLFVVKCGEIEVSFTNYVKSQVHLNISADLMGLPMSFYVDTLRYMDGLAGCRGHALTILRQFYVDMSGFLIKNPVDVKMNLIVDCGFGCTEVFYRLPDVKNQVLGIIDNGGVEGVRSFKYPEIIDNIDNVSDLKEKINSYSVAAVLLKEIAETKGDEVHRVRIEGGF